MTWGRVGHLHSAKLKERLAQRHSAQQQMSVADVTGSVFVGGTSGAAPDSVHVLIAFGRVLPEIDPSPEHPPDIGVPFVEPLLYYCVNEGRSVEEHSFVALIMIFFGNLLPSMDVSLPQLPVLDFLYLKLNSI
jgi:hypothetical protein